MLHVAFSHFKVFDVCFSLFQIEHKSLTLGEVLDGDRMAVSMYEINFKGKHLTVLSAFQFGQIYCASHLQPHLP